jgi:hypothetical protein
LQGKINELETKIKNKNIRDLYGGINEFKRGYQLRNNLLKDLLADSHNIFNRWKKCFSQLLNVRRISHVRHIETHTAEPLVPDPNPVEVEIAIAMLEEVINRQVMIKFWQN